MKKYVYLFLTTAAIITAVFMSGYLIKGSSADVYTVRLKKRDIDNTVSVQGKVQYGTEKEIKTDNYCIIGEVFVSDGDIVEKGDALFSYSVVDKKMENIAAAAEYYDLNEISEFLSENISAVNSIKENIDFNIMYSNSDGTVSAVGISEGDYIENGKEVMRITNKSSLEILANINESMISNISVNQRVNISFPAFQNEIFDGTVSSISDEANQTTGLTGKETTVGTIISVNDNTDKLRAGYTANCSIITSCEKNALIVPYECIRSDNKGDYVYSVSNNTAVKTYLETGKEYRDGVLVKSGIGDGAEIIENCDYISDGQRINIIDKENSDE